MEQLMRSLASYVALALEVTAVVLVVIGAAAGAFDVIRGREGFWSKQPPLRRNKEAFLRFASWLVLALEFELAADIVRTAISPTWTDIGKLGAIAVIRTGLNFFLERDLDAFQDAVPGSESLRAPSVQSENDRPTNPGTVPST
jgi:uncharacterized membrane protein